MKLLDWGASIYPDSDEMIKQINRVLRTKGIVGLVQAIYFKIRGLSKIQAESFLGLKSSLQNRVGIEIGGSSIVFSARGIFPVYPIVARMDNCNFGGKTIWEGTIKEGQTFRFNKKKSPGHQYIAETTALGFIPSETYDFLLSSHVLEHTANPILALTEWVRILKVHGLLIMLLPHKEGTFDHRRPVTTMQHLLSDLNAGMGEDDLTHMPEILALHDLSLDPEAGDWAAFKTRSERNFENRCFHHHVFDTQLAVRLIDHMGLQIHAVEAILPMHILVIAQKLGKGKLPNNSNFTSENARYRHSSPFLSDHSSAAVNIA